MKVFFRSIHLYLSLAAGLIIFTSCITGVILVFETEWTQALNKNRYEVLPAGNRLSADSLVQRVKERVNGASISSVKIYTDAARTAEITYSDAKEMRQKPGAQVARKAGKGAPQKADRKIAFVNPYTGEVIELFNHKEGFFFKVMSVHRWLLSGETGKLIVGISTIMFIFILISGIILWWPKSRNILKQRIRVQWEANWKRLTHDLHVVLGFYACIFLLVIALTGIGMSFSLLKSSPKKEEKMAPAERTAAASGSQLISIEDALAIGRKSFGDARFYTVNLPASPAEPIGIVTVSRSALQENASDIIYLDPRSGTQTGSVYFKDRAVSAKVYSLYKPVHTGTIFGLPSRIIMFLVALMGASFPITGTIMWLRRIKKKKAFTKKSDPVCAGQPA